ncbi:MAG: Na+/H+ antiporter NhaA [Chitinophagaceae bacterium]|nr:Na+/H+ antiporter NhaA [Chitinophagaceae bacterium]
MAGIKTAIKRVIISPLREFILDSRATGITLLFCTFLSLVVSNVSTSTSVAYVSFWNTSIYFPILLHLPHTLLHWINDLLMAAFFFLVGMEIKRELLKGELSSFRKAILPIAAAIGGMLAPACIYALFNKDTQYISGWGIPMATDIAFSLGVVSLLGRRVPISLKIFLIALAIIDDLGAILVIALFYGETVNWLYLALSGLLMTGGLLLTYYKKMKGWLLMLTGLLLWYFIFNSGIHATIAGVLLASLVPLNKLEQYEHRFHDPVNFIILPLFVLANTALVIPGNFGEAINTSLSWGIILGLVVGKPLGIVLFSWVVVKLKWGQRPAGSNWTQMLGIGLLAGIGFTMSIFITMLAFNDIIYQDISKIATMIASFMAVLLSIFVLYLASSKRSGTYSTKRQR